MWNRMLQLFVIVNYMLVGVQMQQTTGVAIKDDTTPYRRVSTQCNPQEASCEEVDPKAGILAQNQLIDQIDLNSTEAGQINSSSTNQLGDLPAKQFLSNLQMTPPVSEEKTIPNPSEEDQNSPQIEQPQIKEPAINTVLPFLNQFPGLSLAASPLPSILPQLLPSQQKDEEENQKSPAQMPQISPVPSPSPEINMISPSPDKPIESPLPSKPIQSPSPSPLPDKLIQSPSPSSSPDKITQSPTPSPAGFNPTNQQAQGVIRNNSSESKSECGITVKGCVCQKEWEFNGGVFEGCQNPDNDKGGAWCIVKQGSCIDPGEIRDEGTQTSTGKYFDYCGLDCQDNIVATTGDTVVAEEDIVVVEEDKGVQQDNNDINDMNSIVDDTTTTTIAAPQQDISECIEVVNECQDNQYSVAFADGQQLASITYQDYSYSLVQGWWNLDKPDERIRWCSPSKAVALFVQAFGTDKDRTSDIIWDDQFTDSRQYCVPNDGQQYSLLQFVSNNDPNIGFYNDAYTNFTSCDQYNGTLKRFFVYQTPQVLTINQCQ